MGGETEELGAAIIHGPFRGLCSFCLVWLYSRPPEKIPIGETVR